MIVWSIYLHIVWSIFHSLKKLFLYIKGHPWIVPPILYYLCYRRFQSRPNFNGVHDTPSALFVIVDNLILISFSFNALFLGGKILKSFFIVCWTLWRWSIVDSEVSVQRFDVKLHDDCCGSGVRWCWCRVFYGYRSIDCNGAIYNCCCWFLIWFHFFSYC